MTRGTPEAARNNKGEHMLEITKNTLMQGKKTHKNQENCHVKSYLESQGSHIF